MEERTRWRRVGKFAPETCVEVCGRSGWSEKRGDEAEKRGDEAEKRGDEAEKRGDEAEKRGDEAEKRGDEAEKRRYEPEKRRYEPEKRRHEPEKRRYESEKRRHEPEKRDATLTPAILVTDGTPATIWTGILGCGTRLAEDVHADGVRAAADADGRAEDDDDALARRAEAGRQQVPGAPVDELVGVVHRGHLAGDDAPVERHPPARLGVRRVRDDGHVRAGQARRSSRSSRSR